MPPPSLCQSGTFVSEANTKQLGARERCKLSYEVWAYSPPPCFQDFGTPMEL